MVINTLPVLNPNYPADATVMQGSGYYYMEVILERPSECTYQWYWGDGTKIVGATEPSLGINRYSAIGNHYAYCEVTNAMGTVRSRTATLTVIDSYLYKSGNVSVVAGGFDLVSATTQSGFNMGEFQNTDMLRVSMNATGQKMQGFCTTRNPIDLTDVKTIRYTVVTSYTSDYYAPWTFCATSTKSGAIHGEVANISVNVPSRTDTTTRTYDLDVSGVSGEYYVGFGNAVSGVNTYIGVSAIQLL